MANLPPGFVLEGPNGPMAELPPGFHLEQQQPAPYQATDDMNWFEKGLAGYGRGVAELGQGAKQLALHGAGAIGLADPQTVSDYDKQVAEDARIYNKDLGQTTAGKTGSILGQLITTAPIGGVEFAAAKEALPLAGAVGRSALAGATAGAAQPVTEGDFATQKALQTGLGAGIGAAAQPVLAGAGKLLEDVLPSNATKTLLNLSSKREQSVNPEFVKESERIAAETGVNLTPAQVSGSKPAQMAENMARQSIFSRGIANEGDRARIDALKDYYDRTIGGISQSDASPEMVGNQVRAATNNTIKSLQDWRDKTAAEDFGKIRAMTRGAATIQPESTNGLLKQIFEENDGIGTPTGDALARFAKKQLENVAPQAQKQAEKLAMTPGNTQEAMQLAQEAANRTAPAQGNLDKLMQLRSYLSKVAGGQAKISGDNQDRRIAAQLLGSIDQDIDAASQQIGGDLGGALKLANARYRESSQQIDSVKLSPIGRLLGEDVAGAMQAGQFNTLPPEKVAERLFAMKPSEIGTVRGLLEQDQPQAWQAIKAGYLQNAMEKAMQQGASAGANTSAFVPTKLANALGDARQLKALFDQKELAQINNIVGAAKRLGDATGYNFSGTAPAGEALGFMNQLGGALKQGLTGAALKGAASAVSPVLGTRALARAMTDANGRATLMQLQRLPPESAQARQLTAWLAANFGSDTGE